MKTLFFFFVVAFLLLAAPNCSSADLVSETCQKTPKVQLCISTLNSDPKSKTADVAGLGLIAVEAVKSKSVSTSQKINSLLKSDPTFKAPLTECANNYKLGILTGDVPEAKDGLSLGNYKFAVQGMNDAANEADGCESGLGGSGKSPLTSENNLVRDLALVASAIAQTLL